MLGRWLKFGLIYIAGGLPIAYLVITSENQRLPLIAFGVYFLAAVTIGNWFIFFSGKSKPRNGNEK